MPLLNRLSKRALALSVLSLCLLGLAPASSLAATPASLEVSPAVTQLGTVPVGSTAYAYITITNGGEEPLTIHDIDLKEVDSNGFGLDDHECVTAALQQHESCTATVSFAPQQATPADAGYRIDSNAGSATFNVEGTGEGEGLIASPTIVSYPGTPVGEESSETVTLSASAGAPTSIGFVSLEGPDAEQFSLGADTCRNRELKTGSCTIEVKFAPKAAGYEQATLAIESSSSGSPTEVPLSGEAETQAHLSVTPQSHNYGGVPIDSHPSQTFTVSDSGRQALHVGSASVIGPDAGQFTISEDTCAAQTLSGSETCEIAVEFIPSAIQPDEATLAIQSSDTSGAAEIPLTGEGLEALPAGLITPSTFDYPATEGGQTASKTFTVENTGGGVVEVEGEELSGVDSSEFEKTADSCKEASLKAGETCTITVVFTPRPDTGETIDEVVLIVNTSAGQDNAALQGKALEGPPVVELATATGFGSVYAGQEATREISIYNEGGGELEAGEIDLTGADASKFAILSNTCVGHQIPANGSCGATVAFRPTAEGAQSAKVVVHSNATNATAEGSLEGRGFIEPEVTPSSKSFGATYVGEEKVETFTVTNRSAGPLALEEENLYQSSDGQFRVLSDSCEEVVLPAAGSCEIRVAFKPSSAQLDYAEVEVVPAVAPALGFQLEGEGVAKPATVSTEKTTTNTTTTTPTTTTPPSAPPAPALPVVVLKSATLQLAKGAFLPTIECREASCVGLLRLTEQVTVKIKKGGRTIAKHETVLLASGRYSLAAGTSKAVELRVTAAGRRAFAHVGKRHPLRGLKLTTLPTSGNSVTRVVAGL
jgi:Abnormal spindle-like microcephaly-assoc'd, ASPM-SPD-2-Hydin